MKCGNPSVYKGLRVFQFLLMGGGVTRSQTRRDTNFAIPGYSISAMIPRRGRKSKIFLSVVIPVVKGDFVPFSATGGKPAIARAARLCGLLSKPRMDRVYALPKQACYQLLYTRICTFRCGSMRLHTFKRERRFQPRAFSVIPLSGRVHFPTAPAAEKLHISQFA